MCLAEPPLLTCGCFTGCRLKGSDKGGVSPGHDANITLSLFLMYVFTTIHFPLGTAFVAFHNFWYVLFSLSFVARYFLISLECVCVCMCVCFNPWVVQECIV